MYYYSSRKTDDKIKEKLFITALISIIPFVIIVIITFFGWERLTQIDYQISHYFYEWHGASLTRSMTVITHLGDMITQTLVTVLTVVSLFIFRKWRTALWYGFTVLAGALLLNGTIKEFYGRARPSQINPLVEIGGYSFPSGHSMGSVIVYGGLLFLLLRSIRSSRLKVFLSVFTFIMISSIGLSRIYLAVHFPSDVVGGFSLGLSWLVLSIALLGLKYTNTEFRTRKNYSLKNF